MGSEKKQKLIERFKKEIKEKGKTSMAKRREGPFFGLVAFSIALWGSKLFTFLSPGTSMYFEILGYEIHFHHFNYGIIALAIGIIITFFEGVWYVRFGHILFGAGLGFIIDEYWLLLIFDDTLYFTTNSYFISTLIGAIFTVIYLVFI
ncbi:MAG: hypothetical protein GF329_19470, partial [Candidatus Lokiarchaeota archaeon]|nr:hypothetical protein [Candidatus Lokiarchaeota archaeon]